MDKKGSYPKHDQQPSNITDFYDTWDSSLSLLKEHIQNVIKNPGPSQDVFLEVIKNPPEEI